MPTIEEVILVASVLLLLGVLASKVSAAARRFLRCAPWYENRATAARIATMATVTISSIKVKPPATDLGLLIQSPPDKSCDGTRGLASVRRPPWARHPRGERITP